MNIKKVDDKPMVIHTKEKAKLHIKAKPETKIKGRNVLMVEKCPKIAGADKEDKADSRKAAMKVRSAQKNSPANASAKEEIRKSIQKENGRYAQMKKSKQDREKAIGKKNSTTKTVASVGAMTALDQMEGGNEVYESYQVARTLSAQAVSAANAGRRLYRSQAAKAQAQKIKKVQAGKKIGKKAIKDSASTTAKYTAKKVAKETAKTVAKEGAKATAKVVTTTATTAAGTAVSPGVGTAIGIAAGYAAGVAVDYKDMPVTNRNRKLKFFLDKLNAEEQQKDSFAKLVKLQRIESGETACSVDKLMEIAQILNTSTDFLLFGKEQIAVGEFATIFEGKNERQKAYLKKIMEVAANNLEMVM